MARLLLVEDDPKMIEMIADWSSGLNYDLTVRSDGQEGLNLLLSESFQLVILDWEIPSIKGVDICAAYRKAGGKAPVLMLTGKSALEEKEKGFAVGVDDYLPKPFQVRELTVRVKALLRRSSNVYIPEKLAQNQLSIDRQSFTVTHGDAALTLRPKEFALLEFLLRNPGQMFTADELVDRVWQNDTETTAAGLRTCINRIVEKMEEAGTPVLIHSSRAYGYWCELVPPR